MIEAVVVALSVSVLTGVYYAVFRVTREKAGRGRRTAESSAESDRDGERGDDADPKGDPSGSARVDLGPRWDPGTTVALLAGAAGVLLGNTTVFLAGIVGFAYTAYRRGTRPPEPEVTVERTVSDRSPPPSREVEVVLTVTNVGDRPIPDLRIVDGVPEGLAVVSGSPRGCVSLRAGESASVSYGVAARRGSHEFGPTEFAARNVSGSTEYRFERSAAATITCETRAEDFPLPAETSSYPGHITTDSGGEGVEFYATREYQPGDSLSRIDWNRFAQFRELTTVEFRETRAATVLLVLDVRTPAHVARGEDEPDAVELGAYAAERLAAALLRRNDRVGLALYGPAKRYVAPAVGDGQAARIRSALEPTPSPARTAGPYEGYRRSRADESRFDALRKRMPDSAQVIFLSPLADDVAAAVAERFRAYGHPVTLVSPDVTATETPGGAVERIERDRRLASVREAGARVVDWSPDDPIRTAVSKATARWSR